MLRASSFVRERLQRLQAALSFANWDGYPAFDAKRGPGRVALLACALGAAWGAAVAAWIPLTLRLLLAAGAGLPGTQPLPVLPADCCGSAAVGDDRIQLLQQWCAYAALMATFHLAEFFVTALCNPTTLSADSFLVNHSTAYTAAFLTSFAEWLVRFLLFPAVNVPWTVSWIGLVVTVAAQIVRTTAMAQAGESFHHLIQTQKRDNHVLVTTGLYSVVRHPSYMGFFFWSVGTQVVLGNAVHAAAFAVASWSFFRRRIDFEEESLCQFFPEEYPPYVARTVTGIPFLRTRIKYREMMRKKKRVVGCKRLIFDSRVVGQE